MYAQRGLIKRRRRPLLLPPHYAIMIRNQSALYSAPPAILEESSVIASARDNEFIVGPCKIVAAPRASVKFPFPSSLPKILRAFEFLVRATRCPDRHLDKAKARLIPESDASLHFRPTTSSPLKVNRCQAEQKSMSDTFQTCKMIL